MSEAENEADRRVAFFQSHHRDEVDPLLARIALILVQNDVSREEMKEIAGLTAAVAAINFAAGIEYERSEEGDNSI